MKMRMFPAAVVVALGLSAASAHADAIPPDVSACDTKTAGATCSVLQSTSGTCESATCSKPDYGHLNDAGQPTLTSYACLQCIPSDGGTSSGNDGGITIPDPNHGGCSAGGARTAGSFGLALVPLLAIRILSRRERRKRKQSG